MYLKTLEMVGFKSFASKTALDFEPGMTSIVGPNGCGKSNISDAIRWVLGEQSPKAMRGSKMEDCIFTGTDSRKPMGMAEVSITFADCEAVLGTEYNEVKITRRVFRSGEGQYFINKTPCRLRDVQRLFMDTGIGTTSYSVMEQGRIDRILSSRPEDRRAVFEEASGVTKFKADKKEAIRKLEYTEANLLRLADVIREVKRQIGSLQRQAGKARRYKELKEELRTLDLLTTRERLRLADESIRAIESQVSDAQGRSNATHRQVDDLESENAALREALVQTEREIGTVMEAGVQAQSALDHTHELIRVNHQRIEEYRALSVRDSREIEETTRQLNDARGTLAQLTEELVRVRAEHAQSEQDLKLANGHFSAHQQQMESGRTQIQRLREESVEVESLISKLQNHLVEIDSRERSSVVQRERLTAEKAQLQRVVSSYEKRQGEMVLALQQLQEEVTSREACVKEIDDRKAERARAIADLQQQSTELQSQAAARQAQIELLSSREEPHEDFPAGARMILDETNPLNLDRSKIMGALAAHLDVEPEFRTALEAALRCWCDAILVADSQAARDVLRALERARKGPARILSADVSGLPSHVPTGAGTRLVDHIACADAVRPLAESLIGNVRVVASLDDAPPVVPDDTVYVTRTGSLVMGRSRVEFWMADSAAANPLSRKHILAGAQSSVADVEGRLAECRASLRGLSSEVETLDQAMAGARAKADQGKRTLAQKEGESQIVSREARESRERLETVSWEFENLSAAGETCDTERKSILAQMDDVRAQRERMTAQIAAQNTALQEMESRHSDLQAEVTERRIRFAGLTQKVEHLGTQSDSLSTRVKELEAALDGRSAGILSYETRIEELTAASRGAEKQLVSMEEAVKAKTARGEALRKNRDQQSIELKEMGTALAQTRSQLEEIRNLKSDLEVRYAESKMQRQNQIDRIASEYGLTAEQVREEPLPEPKDGPLPLDAAESMVAEIRTKIDAMGPVNLIAIEEYKELEERYSFLTAQEEDLVNAKQQLMDMIRKINRTTTEMFSKTFDQVNANFQTMFAKLFNGGSAKLVLVNEEDVLECGIEIIARPPGKRLQNVSLLSGGERTLTAVALLFAIYMIKPSPFCLLDELDAALDETNIGRFATVLKEFLSQSQFVVITHNRQTIAAADILYGVTMPEKGISKIVSMRFNKQEREPEPQMAVP